MPEFSEIKETDLDTILDIYNYYLVNTTATFDFNKITRDELKERISFTHGRYKTFLIYENSAIAGFCFITQYRAKPAYDKTAEIGIYLKQQFTGKGLGKDIISHLENIAKENQIEVLIASISGENTASIKLFRKSGYAQCAHYKGIAVKFGRSMDIIDFQKALF
jgi:L-amino acid N-acyltransferase YncA